MDYFILLTIIGFPMSVFLVSNIVKYIAIEEQGEDRKRAINDLLRDIGLDFYYIGVSVCVSIIIIRYNTAVPPIILVYLAIYSLGSGIVSSLYNFPYEIWWRNWCMLSGVTIGMIPILYALYLIYGM